MAEFVEELERLGFMDDREYEIQTNEEVVAEICEGLDFEDIE